MAIYLITFSLSSFLLMLAEKGKGKKITKEVLVFLGLLLPILLACMRKVGIGTDTKVYTSVLYDAALNSNSFFDYLGKYVYSNFQNKAVTKWEIGYNLVVYFSTRLTGSIQGVFFFTHALIIGFIYKGLEKIEGNFSISFSMFLFYLLFYGTSLNLMRQWMAISILFYGFHYLQKGNIKKYIFTVVTATLFHNSGIIGVLILLLYFYLESEKKNIDIAIGERIIDIGIRRVIIVCGVAILLLVGLETLARVLGSINAVFSRYVRVYISGTIKIMPMQIVRRIPILVIVFYNWKRLKQMEPAAPFLCGMLILDLITSQLGGITNQSSRLGYFFSVYEILLFGETVQSCQKRQRFLLDCFFLVYYAFWFYYDMVLMRRAEIVPYLFYFQ